MIKSWHHHKRRNCRCSVAPSLPYIDEAGWSWARKVYSLACPAYCLPLRAHSTYTNSCFDGIPVRHWQSLQSVPQFLAVLSILSTSDPLPYKQSLSDKSGIMSARDLVKSSYSDFRPITESYVPGCSISSRWLLAPCVISITACGLRLSDEAVLVAVALRLGCSVCVSHSCRCGSLVITRDFMAWSASRPQAE